MYPVVPQRTQDAIIVRLSRKQPLPVLPFELQGYVSPDTWATRVPALTNLSTRYSKPVFEGCWLLAALISSIALPAALYSVIFDSLDKDHDDFDGPFREARAISAAILLGVILFFSVPLIIWKMLGKKRADAMVNRWANEDMRMKGPSATILAWKVKMPGVCGTAAELSIALPPNQIPTSFHPAAYLPSWINGPPDAHGNSNNYPYQNGPGLPYMGEAGNVPMYSDEKIPLYTDQRHYNGDVKV